MDLHEMRRDINRARMVLNNADSLVNEMAGLIEGKLKHVSPYTLAKIKKELQNFNAHTGRWKT